MLWREKYNLGNHTLKYIASNKKSSLFFLKLSLVYTLLLRPNHKEACFHNNCREKENGTDDQTLEMKRILRDRL